MKRIYAYKELLKEGYYLAYDYNTIKSAGKKTWVTLQPHWFIIVNNKEVLQYALREGYGTDTGKYKKGFLLKKNRKDIRKIVNFKEESGFDVLFRLNEGEADRYIQEVILLNL